MVTPPYTPRANEKIECFWGSISTNVKIYAGEDGERWDESLPMIMYAYNSMQTRATGFSPYEALLGTKPMTPFETLLLPSTRECQDFTEFTQSKIKVFKHTLKTLQRHQDEYVDYSLAKWKKKHPKKKIFALKDHVLQRVHVKQSKLDPTFGPRVYVITHLNPSGTMAVIAPLDSPFDAERVSCQHLRKLPPDAKVDPAPE